MSASTDTIQKRAYRHQLRIVGKFGSHLRYILAAEAYTDKRLLSLVLRVNSLSRYTVRDDQLPAPACCDLLAPDPSIYKLGTIT
jgi:hypothetical protein